MGSECNGCGPGVYGQEFIIIQNIDGIGKALIFLSGLNVLQDIAVKLIRVNASGFPGGLEDLFYR